jgi:hypothetical protein
MANNLQSIRKHTRLDFTPLNLSCSILCDTPDAPVVQVANSASGEYEPNREGDYGTPTILRPEVRVNDVDKVFQEGVINARLSLDSIRWYVNSELIENVSDFKNKYSILTTEDETRGSLVIRKNVAPSEKYALSFAAKFEDTRTGVIYEVTSSNQILLCSSSIADDKVDCSVDTPTIVYNPLNDTLLQYEYDVAHGNATAGQRSKYLTGAAYERTVTVSYSVGASIQKTLPTDVTMRLCKLGSTTAITANSEANPEVMAISYPSVKFDLRLIDSAEYEVQFVKESKVVCKATIGISRKMEQLTEILINRGADIVVGQTEYFNDCTLKLGNRMIDYPELYYVIQWYTQSRTKNSAGNYVWNDAIAWQLGTKMECDVADTGIGTTKNDAYFDIWVEAEEVGAYSLLTDESGNILTDGTDMLIG